MSPSPSSLLLSPSLDASPQVIAIELLEGLKYANSQEWVKHEVSVATIGITDHAQGHLGEVVFVELPEENSSVSKEKSFGAVENVKETSEILSPISCEVIEVNKKLTELPGLINSSPYEDGWMVKVKPSNPTKFVYLMGPKEYKVLRRGRHSSLIWHLCLHMCQS
ncbi:unnamed protein product [Eruca vesicaria subsp. sativa]|uniref:Glycine cleavage system H protein n=1 Tax=Eruca vesicaria subsp. sativa TaxID=29727 RepID=A0ABC8L7Y4_ERUVS|nr:unnamed protein product [Eruca vesicaria subsp. sativa]